MISYTTRFVRLANLTRSLHALKPGAPEPTILKQIKSLRKRIFLIRNMQAAGVSSLLLCVVCMFLLFGNQLEVGPNLLRSELGVDDSFSGAVAVGNLDFGRCS
jgi:hypothetical protein